MSWPEISLAKSLLAAASTCRALLYALRQVADSWRFAEYEVDTIQYFTELSSLGAKFNRDRYYFDVKVDLPDIR